MQRARYVYVALAILLTFSSTKHIMAEEPSEYIAMLRAALSAFECSHLAVNSPGAEYERSFLFGYDQGQKFMTALTEGKIERQHLSELPILMLPILLGPRPTTEFLLGRMYEAAHETALKEVVYDSEEAQKVAYKNEFSKRNCELIGK